jgi:hypothetical protein
MKDARNIEIMITSSTLQDVQKGRCVTCPNPGMPRRAIPGCGRSDDDEAKRTYYTRPGQALIPGRYVEPLSDARQS